VENRRSAALSPVSGTRTRGMGRDVYYHLWAIEGNRPYLKEVEPDIQDNGLARGRIAFSSDPTESS
jgi:hypothetical protein